MGYVPSSPPSNLAHLTCVGCGYDLHGTAIGGKCPECGETVARSIEALHKPIARGSKAATATFWCGVLSIPLAWFAPVAVILFFVALKDHRTGIAPRDAIHLAIAGLVFAAVGIAVFTALVLA